MNRIDRYNRLEPRSGDRDLENGFAARVHDPLWMLARQWQMGEHQGENASSPVQVECMATMTAIDPLNDDPTFDPTVVPAEAMVESELDDWWTMGRRARLGSRFDPALAADQSLVFRDPPPPYEQLKGRLDGRALWRRRSTIGLSDAVFGADTPPPDSPPAWDSFRFSYARRFETPERPLAVLDHHGGSMDWFSADALEEPAGEVGTVDLEPIIPTPLEYPGAPHSRFWEIEDASVDIGGYPPDTAHFATMLLVDLIYSHGDDWFLFPVTGRAGHILTLTRLKVTDSFGRSWASEAGEDGSVEHEGLRPPNDFSLFNCEGLPAHSLLLWTVAESPLESAPVERVQFGVDEHSNLLWALERIIDSREVQRKPGEAGAAHPPFPPSVPVSDLTGKRMFDYIPAIGAETHWHPYRLDWGAPGEPAFEQWGLADYSLQKPRPMPHPQAEVLKAGVPEAPQPHAICATTMAGGGFELERRWQLARDMQGRPVLWIQRQRRILRNVPARTLRFDVVRETVPEA